MANIAEVNDSYDDGVYLLAVTDPVLGGPEGPDNKAATNLANRTRFQRMRNVTPWRPGAENPYPAHAYCQYGGVTWMSVAEHANVQPGTNVSKWIRWGHTEGELRALFAAYLASGVLDPYALDIDLAAYLPIAQFNNYVFGKGIRYSATVCPNAGPSAAPMSLAAPTLAIPENVYRSALGEVWMYLDNTWRAVANRYGVRTTYANNATNGVSTIYGTVTLHRAGRIVASASGQAASSGLASSVYASGINLNGVSFGSSSAYNPNAGNILSQATSGSISVVAGDVLTFLYLKDGTGSATNLQSTYAYID